MPLQLEVGGGKTGELCLAHTLSLAPVRIQSGVWQGVMEQLMGWGNGRGGGTPPALPLGCACSWFSLGIGASPVTSTLENNPPQRQAKRCGSPRCVPVSSGEGCKMLLQAFCVQSIFSGGKRGEVFVGFLIVAVLGFESNSLQPTERFLC